MLRNQKAHKEFQALIELRRRQYERTKNTHCPLLKEGVYFNNKGFHHALKDGRDHYRTRSDAIMRLNLLPHAKFIIEQSTRFNRPPQLTPATNSPERKDIVHYELVHTVKIKNQKKEIVVVLRRIGRGRLHYYSIRYKKKQNRP